MGDVQVMSKRDYERGIYIKGAFGRRDYMYIYEVAPWAYDKTLDYLKVSIKESVALDISDDWTRELGQVDLARILGAAPSVTNPLPSRLTTGTAYYDSRDRSWNLGDSDVPDLKDRPTRQLGYVYGHLDQVLRQKATTFDLLTYDDAVNDLLAAGLPTSLDTGALRIREQNPLSGFATSAKQDTMITALQIIDDMDIKKWGDTAQTGVDFKTALDHVNVDLSTKARLQPWYQTNFDTVTATYDGSAAPHGLTTRFTYTVPANRIAIIENTMIEALRLTAAGTLGTVDVYILADSVYIAKVFFYNNTVYSAGYENQAKQILLKAGETCVGKTSDGSTGGTVNYRMMVNILEFDT